MFLVRSAFWLTAAFLVIRPGVDLDATAQALSGQALAAGQQVIAQKILSTECDSLQCAGGKAVLAAMLAPEPVTAPPVPMPRPRPNFAG